LASATMPGSAVKRYNSGRKTQNVYFS
jgi:hypothetical protein